MSRRPIDLSPDLTRLQNEGYDIAVRDGFLLVRDVPYVDVNRKLQRGVLISKLNLSADKTNKPDDHVAYWTGVHPCHADGSIITSIQNPSPPQNFGSGIRADFTFSAKADYRDYHHKITTYVGRISGEATKIDPNATARTYPTVTTEGEEGVFKYIDTASSRAGITAINARLSGHRIGIAGLGGTGVYILDFVAKTAVAEIHVFDGDVFSQHNAFRAPSAPTLTQLDAKPQKVNHFGELYSNMRNGIIVHDVFLNESNLHLLDGLDFVFVCIDQGTAKRAVVGRLIANGTSFVDLGMGVVLTNGRLGGIVRVTTSTPETREQAAPHMSFSDEGDEANEYATNIQIAELNALNASLAVIRWKKLFGLYQSMREEIYSGYSIASGEIVTETELS
jgi:ThiF family